MWKLFFYSMHNRSFPDEYALLQISKPVPNQSRLNNLAPEFDDTMNLKRVGGRLRKSEDLDYNHIQPVVLDPKHYICSSRIMTTSCIILEQREFLPASGGTTGDKQ